VRNDRRRAAAELILQGFSPSHIVKETGLPLGVVLNQLYHQVGQGRIRRSDILFSVPEMVRQALEQAIAAAGSSEPAPVRRALKRAGVQVPKEDFDIYLQLRDSRVDLGDMYEFVREIELRLHELVKKVLAVEHGENDWWRKAIPLTVREDCAVRNERDPEPVASLYCYTTVMHLRLIFDKEWNTLSRHLPSKVKGDKQAFLADLSRLNRIRNVVMHPVKGILLSEGDFEFVRALRNVITHVEESVNEVVEPVAEAA
jgi:hypothetical protein